MPSNITHCRVCWPTCQVVRSRVLVQQLRPVIGLHDLAARLVCLGVPPRIDPPAHAGAIGGDVGGGAHRIRRAYGQFFIGQLGIGGDFQEGLGDAEHVMPEHAIAARAVRHLGFQPVVRHLRNDSQRDVQEPVEPRHQLGGRQDRAGLLVQAEELHHMGDVLGEHELVAAREHGNRARTQPPQLSQPGGVFQHVDGFELDRTDREKLFEFQATGSSRLPERLQCRGHRFPHRQIRHFRPAGARGVNTGANRGCGDAFRHHLSLRARRSNLPGIGPRGDCFAALAMMGEQRR